MGMVGKWDKESVINVLIKGRELADQLREELHPTVSSRKACGYLVEGILSTYDNALSLINCMALLGNGSQSSTIDLHNMLMKSSSLSEGSAPNSVDQPHVSKKRKLGAGRSEVVRVCRVEGGTDDGYNWRKYGQKNILGANHPRAYYRCTHRKSRGCLATKQIQRKEGNSSMLDVIYRGKHTCIQVSKEEKKENVDVQMKDEEEGIEQHLRKMIIPTEPELEVEIQEMSSVSIPSTPGEHVNVGTDQIFLETQKLVETIYSPPFLSPATSDSFFSSISASHMNDFGFSHNYQSVESDFGEIISNPAPATHFSDIDLDFLIEQADFSSSFFDAPDYFL